MLPVSEEGPKPPPADPVITLHGVDFAKAGADASTWYICWLSSDGQVNFYPATEKEIASMTDKTFDFADDSTDASVVHELSRLAEGNVPALHFTTGDNRRFMVRRDDFVIEDKTLPNAADVLPPKIVTATVTVQRASSLTSYMNIYKNAASLLFADIDRDTVVGAIDYHQGGSTIDPRHNKHTATLQLKRSEEWNRWTQKNEKLMDQVEFADFLEENHWDVSDPTGAELLELCRDLHASDDQSVKSVVRDGDVIKIAFQKETGVQTTDGIEMPSEFAITIPVYFGEPPVTLTCLMRRKVQGPNLLLGFKIVRLEAIRQSEFQRVVEAVSVDTNLPAIYGVK